MPGMLRGVEAGGLLSSVAPRRLPASSTSYYKLARYLERLFKETLWCCVCHLLRGGASVYPVTRVRFIEGAKIKPRGGCQGLDRRRIPSARPRNNDIPYQGSGGASETKSLLGRTSSEQQQSWSAQGMADIKLSLVRATSDSSLVDSSSTL